MTDSELKALEILKKQKFDYVFRNDAGQLFAIKGDYKLLLDSEYFPTITIPCPIYQLERVYKCPTDIDKEILKVWIHFLESGKTDVVIRSLRKMLSEQEAKK